MCAFSRDYINIHSDAQIFHKDLLSTRHCSTLLEYASEQRIKEEKED